MNNFAPFGDLCITEKKNKIMDHVHLMNVALDQLIYDWTSPSILQNFTSDNL